MKRLLLLPFALFPATVVAQSMNIDINRNSAGFTAPSAAYGAAAGQPGTWNQVNGGSSGSQNLVALNGAASGCTITKDGNSGSSTSFPGTGDWASLIEDYDYSMGIQTWIEYSINGLDEGTYIVYVYGCSVGDDAFWVDTFGFDNYYQNGLALYVGLDNISEAYTTTSGPVTANVLEQGVTHGVMVVTIPAGAPALRVRSSCAATNHERSALNGVQLVKLETNRLYVNKNAATPGSGLAWGSALKEVRSALSLAAQADGAIDEIWVAFGEYYPAATALRQTSFIIPSGVQLYGGFNGLETQLSERNIEGNLTVLSGDPAQTPTLADNCYHVIKATNANSTTRIDGFTIQEGQATGVSAVDQDGAAAYIDGSSIKFFNCKFDLCQAQSEGGHCYLTNNSSPAFVQCSFFDGYAVSYGGSIRNTTDSRFSAWNCFFGFNGADLNGGAINSTSEVVSLYNCVFSNNFCGSNGGAVYIFGADVSASVINCTFGYNDAGDFDTTGSIGGLGGASNAELTVKNSVFYGNSDNNAATSTETANLGLQSSATIALIERSLVQGWTGGYGGTGNFTANPLFIDPNGADNQFGTTDDNYGLAEGSPCIDKGADGVLPIDTYDLDGDGVTLFEPVPFDVNGDDRFVDLASVPNGPVGYVDIGAVERQDITLGDMNCDGLVNFFDIDPFLMAMFEPATYEATFPDCNMLNGDMDASGAVNFFDIDPFVACVFGACP